MEVKWRLLWMSKKMTTKFQLIHYMTSSSMRTVSTKWRNLRLPVMSKPTRRWGGWREACAYVMAIQRGSLFSPLWTKVKRKFFCLRFCFEVCFYKASKNIATLHFEASTSPLLGVKVDSLPQKLWTSCNNMKLSTVHNGMQKSISICHRIMGTLEQ